MSMTPRFEPRPSANKRMLKVISIRIIRHEDVALQIRNTHITQFISETLRHVRVGTRHRNIYYQESECGEPTSCQILTNLDHGQRHTKLYRYSQSSRHTVQYLSIAARNDWRLPRHYVIKTRLHTDTKLPPRNPKSLGSVLSETIDRGDINSWYIPGTMDIPEYTKRV